MAKTEIDSKAAEAANEEQVKETETPAFTRDFRHDTG